MSAIIILIIGTIACLLRSRTAQQKEPYLITAIIFLIMIGSHILINPNV